ncbi:hypothetical protein F2Q70_00016724 [Brassica cretica]|uniref:Uncharacterized protein n=1 Tax=Brassica cretica TaxID=69181 RepID=A0A8S9HXV1_BRACR|nr:hypothetical protein F2Q70_00016724 [Brassica cretica]
MTEREAYVKMAVAHAKAIEANNEFAATLEKRLQDVPCTDELYGRDRPPKKAKMYGSNHRLSVSGEMAVAKPCHWQFSHSKDCPITEDPDSVSHLVRRHFKPAGCLLPSLRNMTEREAYVKMAVAHAKAMEANNEFAANLEKRLQDVLLVSNKRKLALEQVPFLEAKVESSANKFSDDLRRATYDAKKTLVDSYLDVLISLKENWEKKKDATDFEARLREVMANLDLLKEIMNNNLLASDELLRLRTKEVELGSGLDVMAVSDFSIEKLDLPQITEDLPEDFFAKVPSGMDDTGDRMKRAGGQFEDGEFGVEE